MQDRALSRAYSGLVRCVQDGQTPNYDAMVDALVEEVQSESKSKWDGQSAMDLVYLERQCEASLELDFEGLDGWFNEHLVHQLLEKPVIVPP